MNTMWDVIWVNAVIVTGKKSHGVLENAAIAVKDGMIAWIGKMHDLTAPLDELAKQVVDVTGCCITPGLIDCHTHLIYAGDRSHEFSLRLQGISYEEIAQRGGGIAYTVTATRAASEDELFDQSVKRAAALMKSGVTTLEIKSGYGLDWDTEAKMLMVAKRIENALPLTISKTFLGAHTIPSEYKEQPDRYVDLLCNEMIPRVAEEKLAEAVDVFCENIAFNLAQTERIFQAAKQAGLAIKCHAEQLSASGALALAATYQAQSAEHLEHANEAGIKKMATSKTVAVLLPFAFYFLREKKLPPIDLLRQYQVPIAIASDCNPGTSPVLSLPLVLNMACTLFRLTPEEAFLGVTSIAASALGMSDVRGTLCVGMVADLAVWSHPQPEQLVYYAGDNPLKQLVKAGKVVV